MADIEGLKDASKEYAEHTKKYTMLLGDYITHTKESNNIKNRYKQIFFFVILGMMVVLVALFFISVFKSFNMLKTLSGNAVAVVAGVVTTMISSFVTMVVSIFKLPKIIAEYLFNPEEDKNMGTIIRYIQKYDVSMYKIQKDIEDSNVNRVLEVDLLDECDGVPENLREIADSITQRNTANEQATNEQAANG